MYAGCTKCKGKADGGRNTANMLQFKLNPAELFETE